MTSPSSTTDVWHIGCTPLHSRFLLGTAGYSSPDVLRQAIEASGSQVLTLGLKRTLAAPGGGDNGFVQIIRDTAQAHGAHLLPNTADTHDIYDAPLFAQFKPEGVFINVGRGVAVVDADLVEALRQGHLAAAIIDVCRQEPLPSKHPFWTAWGLLLTGHSSAPTSPPMMVQLFVDNLRAYQTEQTMRGEVDFERGY